MLILLLPMPLPRWRGIVCDSRNNAELLQGAAHVTRLGNTCAQPSAPPPQIPTLVSGPPENAHRAPVHSYHFSRMPQFSIFVMHIWTLCRQALRQMITTLVSAGRYRKIPWVA